MDVLCMDVKIYIASKNAYTWLKMYTYDEMFKKYACTTEGCNMFVRTFTKTIGNQTRLELFNLLHSIDDKPAKIINREKKWYCMGKLHRNNDLPAIIESDGSRYWYQHGEKHRENDLPTVILASGSQWWYQHGERHRDNDKPAITYASGDQEWYKHGKLIKKEKLM